MPRATSVSPARPLAHIAAVYAIASPTPAPRGLAAAGVASAAAASTGGAAASPSAVGGVRGCGVGRTAAAGAASSRASSRARASRHAPARSHAETAVAYDCWSGAMPRVSIWLSRSWAGPCWPAAAHALSIAL